MALQVFPSVNQVNGSTKVIGDGPLASLYAGDQVDGMNYHLDGLTVTGGGSGQATVAAGSAIISGHLVTLTTNTALTVSGGIGDYGIYIRLTVDAGGAVTAAELYSGTTALWKKSGSYRYLMLAQVSKGGDSIITVNGNAVGWPFRGRLPLLDMVPTWALGSPVSLSLTANTDTAIHADLDGAVFVAPRPCRLCWAGRVTVTQASAAGNLVYCGARDTKPVTPVLLGGAMMKMAASGSDFHTFPVSGAYDLVAGQIFRPAIYIRSSANATVQVYSQPYTEVNFWLEDKA